MKRLLLLLACVAAFVSCSTHVPVKKVLPPEIVIPEGKESFLFASRFVADSLDFNNQNKIDVFRKGHHNYLMGFKSGFDTSRYFHVTMIDTLIGSHATVQPGPELSSTDVAALCATNACDYLISLDAYNLFFDQEVEVVEQEDGSKTKTAYYDLVLEVFIAVYDGRGKQVDKLRDEIRIKHDERSVLSGLLAIGPSMGKADKNVILISDELGRKFIQKFYPYTIFEQREFYFSKPFKPAYKAYKTGNMAFAEADLIRLSKDGSRETAGRAAYNLAVVYENMNRHEDMVYWYEKARTLLGYKVPYLPTSETGDDFLR